jgi:hypothetical protein
VSVHCVLYLLSTLDQGQKVRYGHTSSSDVFWVVEGQIGSRWIFCRFLSQLLAKVAVVRESHKLFLSLTGEFA